MWSPVLVWLSALSCFIQAVQGNGWLFLYDDTLQGDQRTHRTLSPNAARLIIASRLGVERYHDLGSGSEAEFAAVNEYASGQKLFAQATQQQSVALLLAQGHDRHGTQSATSTHLNDADQT